MGSFFTRLKNVWHTWSDCDARPFFTKLFFSDYVWVDKEIGKLRMDLAGRSEDIQRTA